MRNSFFQRMDARHLIQDTWVPAPRCRRCVCPSGSRHLRRTTERQTCLPPVATSFYLYVAAGEAGDKGRAGRLGHAVVDYADLLIAAGLAIYVSYAGLKDELAGDELTQVTVALLGVLAIVIFRERWERARGGEKR